MTLQLFALLLSFSLTCNTQRTSWRPDCLSGVDYATAVAHCSSYSAELCTLDEINAKLSRNSGCGFDGNHLWTISPCDTDSHWIATTGSSPDPSLSTYYLAQSDKPPECTLDTATLAVSDLWGRQKIGVACCSNTTNVIKTDIVDVSRSGKSYGAVSVILLSVLSLCLLTACITIAFLRRKLNAVGMKANETEEGDNYNDPQNVEPSAPVLEGNETKNEAQEAFLSLQATEGV